ncbi:MAG TPA: hypothetical protein VGV35_08115 [Bryobacteraceae bacterium]|nr:hypothetical protein [Bryobacteraceae bacterium]
MPTAFLAFVGQGFRPAAGLLPGLCLTFLCLTALLAAQTREHAETNITFDLPAPPATALPLFGPVRESEWSPQWNPAILFPADQRQVAGAVFTTKQQDAEMVWMLITYDQAALRVEYVIVWPGMCATRLDISLKPSGPNASQASVTYRRTALSEAGDKYVKDFAARFPSQRDHWQQAISTRLHEMEKK